VWISKSLWQGRVVRTMGFPESIAFLQDLIQSTWPPESVKTNYADFITND